MQVQPYLFFEGRCEEAIEFYRQALGAEVVMMLHYKDSPVPPPPDKVVPGSENKVMHATLQIGESVVMVSDGGCSNENAFGGFSLALSVTSKAEAERLYAALSAGGEAQMPLGETFFSPCFGMLKDRFGMGWMINMQPQS